MNKKTNPSKLLLRFFHWYCHPDYQEDIEGDLLERFEVKVEEQGYRKAKWGFAKDVIRLFRPGIIRSFSGTQKLNQYDMIKHNLKISYRNLLRSKGYSLINIGGLAVGMMVAILIGLWIHDELSFDKHQENYPRIAQVMQHQMRNIQKRTEEPIPMPLGDELRDKYGNDFEYVVMSTWSGGYILSHANTKLSKTGRHMEPDAPHLLSLKMLKGTRDGLKDPASILLSATTAKSLFGESEPMNKVVKIGNKLNVTVTGVYEDIPFNSRFYDLSFIAPWELLVSSEEWLINARNNPEWDDNSFNLFVQIADNTEIRQVSARIKKVKYDNLKESQKVLNSEIFLHPMKDWHLKSSWENGIKTGGPIVYVWLFGIVGFFVLILACINFMNLSTAQSEKRAREIGVRKALGSVRSQLIQQFLSESFLIVILAYFFAILMATMTIPSFNQLAGKQIILPFTNLSFWMISLGFIIITSLLAGSYPALYLSSLRPVNVLKGTLKASWLVGTLRRVLVVGQFTVSVALIIGTIVVAKQVEHTKDRAIGYDKNGTIMIQMDGPDYYGKYDVLRNELKSRNAIIEMTQSSSPLTEVWNTNDGFSWDEKDPNFLTFSTVWITQEYGKTIGWEIIKGRDFSRDLVTDAKAYILNEAAVEYMNLEDPVGKVMRWNGGPEHEVIGIVKNMLMESPYQAVNPTIYIIDREEYHTNVIILKLNPDKSTQASLAQIEDVFNQYIPEAPFQYQFADEAYARKFIAEERVGKLSGLFAALAIFISCIGLFGMASFVTEKRTKEIGIRKVLGASVLNLWRMLSTEFVLLVAFSCLIAIPISYYSLNLWLQNYQYQTPLHWGIFAISGILGLLVTLLTVSFQSIKAAMMNPVDSLKDE